MTFGKAAGILVVLSLTAVGAAMARDNSGGAAGVKGKPAHLVKGDLVKGGKAAAKTAVVPVRHVQPQAPIVMGRSVSLHHKTKLHHVKMKPLDLPASADGSN